RSVESSHRSVIRPARAASCRTFFFSALQAFLSSNTERLYNTAMPRGRKNKENQDHSLLSMALLGYEQTKAKIETQITAIRKALGAAARSYTTSAAEGEEAPTRKRRLLSAKARKAISLAQKKRWSESR